MEATTAITNLGQLREEANAERAARTALGARAFVPVAQPLVSLSSGSVFGFEALTRPQVASPLDRPDHFLEVASRGGFLAAVEHTWREMALAKFAANLSPDALLFLNIYPSVLLENRFTANSAYHLVRSHGLDPERVVLELTENERISDFSRLRELLGAFRSAGFLIAIDDAGAGPSSLQAAVEVRPHFIKLDRWISTDIAIDSMRRSVVESLVKLAHTTRARVVAEGIETPEQLKAFIDLGVDLGQGYLLGRPEETLQGPPAPVVSQILQLNSSRSVRVRGEHVTVGDLAVPAPRVDESTIANDVMTVFRTNDLVDTIALCDGDCATGLVTRTRLLLRLSGQYGPTIYGRKPVGELVPRATVVDAKSDVRTAAHLALERSPAVVDDPLMVIDDDRGFVGVVAVSDLLRQMVSDEVAEARHANPLTGLPGNQRIRHYIEQRLDNSPDLVFLYADIDNFKHFNDRYGFGAGDHAISRLGQTLQQVAARCAGDVFVGHIGGDDFAMVVEPRDIAEVQAELTRVLATRWYDPDHHTTASALTVTIAGGPFKATAGLSYEDRAAVIARFKSQLKRQGGARFEVSDDLSPWVETRKDAA